MKLVVLPAANKPSSRFLLFVRSFFAGMAIVNTISTFIEVLPESVYNSLGDSFADKEIWGQLILSIIFSVVYSSYWRRKEMAGQIDSAKVNAIFLGLLRYWISFELCVYGFAKIFKNQFAHAYWRDDAKTSVLNGINLTWHFYSYSYSMTVIIALVQIGGSILLLFRRTTLAGAILLLPVLINIVLINIFYHIEAEAFFNSVVFTLGLLCLVWYRWPEIRQVVFINPHLLPVFHMRKPVYLLKILPVLAAFAIVYYYVSTLPATWSAGKWTIQRMVRNSDTISLDNWKQDSSIWSTVYIETGGRLSICRNPYVFDRKLLQAGSYQYDASQKRLRLILSRQSDTIFATVNKLSDSSMEWRARLRTDSLIVVLKK